MCLAWTLRSKINTQTELFFFLVPLVLISVDLAVPVCLSLSLSLSLDVFVRIIDFVKKNEKKKIMLMIIKETLEFLALKICIFCISYKKMPMFTKPSQRKKKGRRRRTKNRERNTRTQKNKQEAKQKRHQQRQQTEQLMYNHASYEQADAVLSLRGLNCNRNLADDGDAGDTNKPSLLLLLLPLSASASIAASSAARLLHA